MTHEHSLACSAPAVPTLAASTASGLSYGVATDLSQVIAAWRMVYMAYRRIELIDANPYRLHTAPQAVNAGTAVITGRIGPLTVSTLTAMIDALHGIPLDRAYPAELYALRREGRRLMEIGLFGDRRKNLNRTAEALFQLMRYAFHYGMHAGVTDFLIGVHPRHARFYTRAFGFDIVGPTKAYAAVNDRPVTLLRGDLDKLAERQDAHPALVYCAENPVPTEVFAPRYRFEPAPVAASELGAYLRYREQQWLALSQSA